MTAVPCGQMSVEPFADGRKRPFDLDFLMLKLTLETKKCHKSRPSFWHCSPHTRTRSALHQVTTARWGLRACSGCEILSRTTEIEGKRERERERHLPDI